MFADKRHLDLWGFFPGGNTDRPKPGIEYPCFECGTPTTGKHHVVPYSAGGRRQLALCTACHRKVHGTQLFGSEMIKAGLAKARKNGTRLGRPYRVDPHMIQAIVNLRKEGFSYKAIARKLKLSVGIVFKHAKRNANIGND